MCDSGGLSSVSPTSSNEGKDEPDPATVNKLNDPWKLWFMKYDSRKSWKANLKLLTAVETVELFFQIHNHILQPSKLVGDSTYFLFKNNIRPEWENSANRAGGKWEFRTKDAEVVNQMWLDLQLFIIGGEDVNYRVLNGCVIQRKHREYRLSLWVSDVRNEQMVMEIGDSFRAAINSSCAVFIPHADRDYNWFSPLYKA